MRFIFALIIMSGLITPVFAQDDVKNPSIIINTIEIPYQDFNRVSRDAVVLELEKSHAISWNITVDNNLQYANPNGNAVLKIYDKNSDKFIEVGMGAPPDEKFWVAVNTEKEGYVVIQRDLERGWYPAAKVALSYTERGGLTVNNGARITVSSLNIGSFEASSYSVHGLEGSTDPIAVNAGSMTVEFLSGDPSQNVFALFPFYLAAGIGTLVGVLYLTKRRS
jgi:helix-turn-helix protein